MNNVDELDRAIERTSTAYLLTGKGVDELDRLRLLRAELFDRDGYVHPVHQDNLDNWLGSKHRAVV